MTLIFKLSCVFFVAIDQRSGLNYVHTSRYFLKLFPKIILAKLALYHYTYLFRIKEKDLDTLTVYETYYNRKLFSAVTVENL
jgi:hypothetical protein